MATTSLIPTRCTIAPICDWQSCSASSLRRRPCATRTSFSLSSPIRRLNSGSRWSCLSLTGSWRSSASWLVRRITAIIRLFIQQIAIMETLSPADFFEFRGALSPASGSESQGFREIEVASGLRDPRLLKFLQLPPGPAPDAPQTLLWTERIARRWEAPSLRDSFFDLLRQRDVAVTDLYRPSAQPNPHQDLFWLAEALLDYDEAFANWRFVHARMAERALGAHISGTGYTSGVPYLDSTVQRPHFFPELWDARSDLWQQRQTATTP
ncbi:MAG: hypothetical protein C4310_00110 [Chloroflexota bacterium]